MIKWETRQQYVNLETGEVLGPKDAQQNYYIVKRKKIIKRDDTNQIYTKIYINQCRIKPTQTTLW